MGGWVFFVGLGGLIVFVVVLGRDMRGLVFGGFFGILPEA